MFISVSSSAFSKFLLNVFSINVVSKLLINNMIKVMNLDKARDANQESSV